MGIKQLKSVTPGSRFASRSDFAELTTKTPEKKTYYRIAKKWWAK
jgi:ribosomal protein L2